jgi:hypothetical protein
VSLGLFPTVSQSSRVLHIITTDPERLNIWHWLSSSVPTLIPSSVTP